MIQFKILSFVVCIIKMMNSVVIVSKISYNEIVLNSLPDI